jgi:hypothetical protein
MASHHGGGAVHLLFNSQEVHLRVLPGGIYFPSTHICAVVEQPDGPSSSLLL